MAEAYISTQALWYLSGPYLEPWEFRAIVAMLVYSGKRRVASYREPDPVGVIDLSDEAYCRICTISRRQLKKLRVKLPQFFDSVPGGLVPGDKSWIVVDLDPQVGWKRPAIPASLRSAVMQRDNFTCCYCGCKDGPFHCDHIVPVSDGGATDLENLICACRFCNSSKRAKDADEWIGSNVVPLRGR